MKTCRLNSYLAFAIASVLAGSVQAQEVASIDEAPNLKAGSLSTDGASQCYARVSVPAVYRTEDVNTETLAELTRYKIIPAQFVDSVKTITETPETTVLTAVQPIMENRTEQFEVVAASKRWVRDSLDGQQPLTQGELTDLSNAGVDFDSVNTGTCLYEHFTEATIEDVPTKVLVSEATEKLSVVDSVWQSEQVKVVTVPAYSRIIEVPPTFKDSTEQVMTAAAAKTWQTNCGAVQQVDYMTGETLCLVDVPAEYKTVETQIVDVPALTTNVDEAEVSEDFVVKTLVTAANEQREAVPAKFDFMDSQRVSKPASYSWIAKNASAGFGAKATGRSACFVATPAKFADYERQVVKTAGRFDSEVVPAVITDVKIQKMVTEARSEKYVLPAEQTSIARQVKVIDARIEWKPVLCQVNFSEDIIAQLQKALTERGYDPGPVDGIMGRGTSRAISAYQKDNAMADAGLTIEILQKLGVKM